MKLRKIIFTLVLFLYSLPCAYAYSDKLIVGGQNIGIEVKTKGILVAGLYKINNDYVASTSGLEKGDYIVEVNNSKINNINDFTKEINNDEDKEKIDIKYLRNNKEYNSSLNLYQVDNEYKTGLYVKDSISGIGTLTFIDPETKKFGALGHEILDENTLKTLKIKDGLIYDSNITGINKSLNGNPGEKEAVVDSTKIFGNISKNTISGVFGNYTGEINNDNLYEIGEAKEGEASLLTVTEGKDIVSYKIKINNVNDNDVTRNISFTINDNSLLEKTGGIVQGMSGSPIIQDNKIVGAVTHVIVDNPKKGYGVLIKNMLLETEN